MAVGAGFSSTRKQQLEAPSVWEGGGGGADKETNIMGQRASDGASVTQKVPATDYSAQQESTASVPSTSSPSLPPLPDYKPCSLRLDQTGKGRQCKLGESRVLILSWLRCFNTKKKKWLIT